MYMQNMELKNVRSCVYLTFLQADLSTNSGYVEFDF